MVESVGGTNGDPERLLSRLRAMKEEIAHKDEDIRLLKLRLELLSTMDGATGLLNRHGLMDSIENALHRIGRGMEPFAVVGITFPALPALRTRPEADVDASMQHIAALLRAALREVDRIARLEGPRFAALLPLSAGTTAEPVLPRLASVLSAGEIDLGGTSYDPTPSFVIVHVRGEGRAEIPTADEIIQIIEGDLSNARPGPVWHEL